MECVKCNKDTPARDWLVVRNSCKCKRHGKLTETSALATPINICLVDGFEICT